MRPVLIGGAALLLAACTTAGGSLQSQAQLASAKGAYGFELAYNTAAAAYNANLSQLAAHGNKAKAKTLMLSLLDCRTKAATGHCTGYVQLARDAADIGSATDVATETAAIQSIADQVAALVAASK